AAEIFSSSTPLDQTLRKAFEQRDFAGWQTIDAPGRGQAPARVAVNVQFVEEQGERVGGLVTLRDASTRARLEDQLDVTATLAAPQARQNNVQLVFDRNGSVPHLRADPDLMKQALLNLVLNGCQAMPSGGQLRVTPRVSSNHFDLEIADQGVGIPPEVQPRIFSLFFSTKP